MRRAARAACHAQMYIMGTILRHGSDAQKERYLPLIASGELPSRRSALLNRRREPTMVAATTARREGNDHYVINGQKIWTSRAEHSDLLLLLARTTPKDQAKKRTDGLSVFLVDMRLAQGASIAINPIRIELSTGQQKAGPNRPKPA